MSIGSIHLCGSVPLANTRDVFQATVERLGSKISNLPDGETGERESWIIWQREIFNRHEAFEAIGHKGDYRNASARIPMDTWWRPRNGVDISTIDLGVLGYAETAKKSYKDFRALKEEGKIGADVRFMIALPTPYNVINMCIAPEYRLQIEQLYEQAMVREVKEITSAIEPSHLSIQWDVAHDMQTYEGSRQCYFAFHQDGIVERLARFGDLVPKDISMGYHLCYGNFGGKHFVEPRDMAPMVDLSNRLCAAIHRPVSWIHMPVPVERDDDAYFEALSGLRMHTDTKLYLGLVHDSDGERGTRRRMATADKFVTGYGIATECGFGRRPPETVAPLLDLHRQLAP